MEKESLQQAYKTLQKTKEKWSLLDKREEVMSQLEKEAQAKMAVIIEGPPVYLWPPSDQKFQALQWESMPFQKGWEFVNTFAEKIPEGKGFQYFLIDDLNYMPKNSEGSDIRSRVQSLRLSSKAMRESALFQKPTDNVKIVIESELAAKKGTTHCSKLDAAFNAQKILDQVGDGGNALLFAGNAQKLMLTVVNPDTIEVRSEQLNMMMELYKMLRSSREFQPYSKKCTVDAITQTFRHVWLDKKGLVTGLSKPLFHGSHFSFANE